MCSVCYLVCFCFFSIIFQHISNCTNKQPTHTGTLIASWAWKLREQISPDCEELNIRTANTWWCLPPSNAINLFERQGLIPASTVSEISRSVLPSLFLLPAHLFVTTNKLYNDYLMTLCALDQLVYINMVDPKTRIQHDHYLLLQFFKSLWLFFWNILISTFSKL